VWIGYDRLWDHLVGIPVDIGEGRRGFGYPNGKLRQLQFFATFDTFDILPLT